MIHGSLVVVEVGPEDAPQTGFMQNNHMVQALPADRTDQTLDIGSRWPRLKRSEARADAARQESQLEALLEFEGLARLTKTARG